MKRLALALILIGFGAANVRAEAMDDDLINSPRLAALQTAVAVPQAYEAPASDYPAAPVTTEEPELTISTDQVDFEPAAPVASAGRGTVVFGVAPSTDGDVPAGVPAAPVSTADAERIRVRNEEAKVAAKRPGFFKFVVDKDASKMAVFDGTTKIGVFNVSFGSNKSDDSYGSSGTRNTPIGVFICHAGRASNNAFTWFIPYDVPGRSAMGIHGPKDTFLGSMLGLIHWTAGCIATHSRADILTIKAAHAIALKRGTPTRLIIGRGLDFQTIPGY